MKVSLSLLWQKSFGGSAMPNLGYLVACLMAFCVGLNVMTQQWGWAVFCLFTMLLNLYQAEKHGKDW